MAVQKNRSTRSKRDTRRMHDKITGTSLSIDSETGETHRRHHISLDGFYRGKEILSKRVDDSDSDEE